MKLQVASDLHIEFLSDYRHTFVDDWEVAADVLVLAGDIVTPIVPAYVLESFCKRWKHVVYVPGNHEFYHRWQRIRPPRCKNLHVLNPGVVEIGEQRFVGATLWFPELIGELALRPHMTDFNFVKAENIHEMHAEDLKFLTAELRSGDVVVTHHLPHVNSVAQQFVGHPLNRFFLAADASPLVESGQAKLWIHGHTHEPCSYWLPSGTRVICHPRGYPHESHLNYQPLGIEV